MTKEWWTIQKIPVPSSPTVPFDIHKIHVRSDGIYPNNELYPTIIYKDAFHGGEREGKELIVQSGDWTDPWVWGIFAYHHYHTKAWELLLCIRGLASIQLGGDSGPCIPISKGDLMLIPPGVAHKEIHQGGGFSLLGSYPTKEFDGRIDTCRGKATEDELERINTCYVPEIDPICNLSIHYLIKVAC